MRQPNTFIIGAPKSGTTALASYLSAHPAAFVCNPKEPFFWAGDFPGLASRLGIRSLDDYHRLFAGAGKDHTVVAEASTNYLCSQEAVGRILDVCPQARFIVMLRDPVEVAHAFHMEQVFAGNEEVLDFEAAWRLQGARLLGQDLPRGCWSPQFLQYGALAQFGEQVTRLLGTVPRSAVLFLRFEDFCSDIAAVWLRVQEFLDLPPDGRQDFPVANAAHGHRFPALARFVFNPPALLRAPVDALRAGLRRHRVPLVESIKARLRRTATRARRAPAFDAELRRFFAADIGQLEALLGWSLPLWRSKEMTCETS